MKQPKPRKKHKLGTFEIWASDDNIFIVKEDGTTEFGYSDGSWDADDWDRRAHDWSETFEFIGYL